MSDITVHANNDVDVWLKRFHTEYVRAMQLRGLMGKSPNAPIQMIRELSTMAGRDIFCSLVTRLTGSGVTGDSTLMGNEEALGNYAHKITIDQLRNAVRIGVMEQKKSHIDYLKAAKPILKDWAMARLRDDIIAALYSPTVGGSTAYGSATEAEKDAWLDANLDRIMVGAAISNLATTAPAGGATYDHSASVLLINNTDDKLTGAVVSTAKRKAKAADPHMRPVTIDSKGEWYTMLAGTLPFRDLKADLKGEFEAAGVRGKDNPLFVDGDLIWDGVIIKEVPEIGVLSGVGAGGIDVAASFLLGAQAVGVAIGKDVHKISHNDDYGNLRGIGVAEIRGVDKLMQNEKQHGVVTVYNSAVADT